MLLLFSCITAAHGQDQSPSMVRAEMIMNSLQSADWMRALDLTDDFIARFPSHSQIELMRTIRHYISVEMQMDKDRSGIEAFFDQVILHHPDSIASDIARLGKIKIFVRNEDLKTVESQLVMLMARHGSGFIFNEAARLYARSRIIQNDTDAAIAILQRIRPGVLNPDFIDESTGYQELMSRLYIDPYRPLEKEMQWGLTNVTLKSPVDLSVRHDGWIYVLDEDQRLLTVNPNSSIERQISILPIAGLHLNTGRLWSTLVVGEMQLIENYNPIDLPSENKKRNVIDAVWASPGGYWVLDRKARSFVLCNETGRIEHQLDRISLRGREVTCLDPNGWLWLLHHPTKSIIRLNSSGRSVTSIPFNGTLYKLKNPSDICFDRVGHLYVLDAASRQIAVFTSQGKFLRWFSLKEPEIELRSPSSLAVGHDGSIYVADKREALVSKYH